MKKWLKNKTVLVSGASGGLGFAISKLLIEKYDCKVFGVARNERKLSEAKTSLGEKSDCFRYVAADLSLRESWVFVKNYLEENGIFPDVIINNAGFMLPFAKFEKYSFAEIDEIVATNFMSCVNSVKILLPLLEKSDSPAIVNIASSAGLAAVVGQSMYCATKSAVKGFTETLIQDYRGKIYVGGVYPGFIRTNILNRQQKGADSKLIRKLMMPVDKAAKKIVGRIAKKKKRTVIGFDGHSLSFFGRMFPSLTPALVRKVLESSKNDMFDEVFDYGDKKKK